MTIQKLSAPCGSILLRMSIFRKIALLTLLTSLAQVNLLAQQADSTLPVQERPDSTTGKHPNRMRLVAGAQVLAYGGTLAVLYQTWYKNYPQSNFHFFDDNFEWKQVDKVGHAWSAYTESRVTMEAYRWAGASRKQRIWLGGLSGFAFQTIIETLDGFSSEWGWSWGDISANTVGSGLLVGQELLWDEQRISFKFSFHKKAYNEPALLARANNLYGTSLPERMLKDYNGQTYWFSANLKSFFKQSNLPSWLNIAVGYGAEGMLGAGDNKWVDKKTGVYYDRTDIPRYRQWYLSPDVDFTRIKTRSKYLKVLFFALNSLKFPAPSVELSQGKLHWNWLHF
jgi:hypothetical protein